MLSFRLYLYLYFILFFWFYWIFISCILIASVCPDRDRIQIWNIVMQSEKWGSIQINTSANMLPNSLLPNSISPQSFELQQEIVVWQELRSICRCVTVYCFSGIETCIFMLRCDYNIQQIIKNIYIFLCSHTRNLMSNCLTLLI